MRLLVSAGHSRIVFAIDSDGLQIRARNELWAKKPKFDVPFCVDLCEIFQEMADLLTIPRPQLGDLIV
jgi:hypothetical protein